MSPLGASKMASPPRLFLLLSAAVALFPGVVYGQAAPTAITLKIHYACNGMGLSTSTMGTGFVNTGQGVVTCIPQDGSSANVTVPWTFVSSSEVSWSFPASEAGRSQIHYCVYSNDGTTFTSVDTTRTMIIFYPCTAAPVITDWIFNATKAPCVGDPVTIDFVKALGIVEIVGEQTGDRFPSGWVYQVRLEHGSNQPVLTPCTRSNADTLTCAGVVLSATAGDFSNRLTIVKTPPASTPFDGYSVATRSKDCGRSEITGLSVASGTSAGGESVTIQGTFTQLLVDALNANNAYVAVNFPSNSSAYATWWRVDSATTTEIVCTTGAAVVYTEPGSRATGIVNVWAAQTTLSNPAVTFTYEDRCVPLDCSGNGICFASVCYCDRLANGTVYYGSDCASIGYAPFLLARNETSEPLADVQELDTVGVDLKSTVLASGSEPVTLRLYIQPYSMRWGSATPASLGFAVNQSGWLGWPVAITPHVNVEQPSPNFPLPPGETYRLRVYASNAYGVAMRDYTVFVRGPGYDVALKSTTLDVSAINAANGYSAITVPNAVGLNVPVPLDARVQRIASPGTLAPAGLPVRFWVRKVNGPSTVRRERVVITTDPGQSRFDFVPLPNEAGVFEAGVIYPAPVLPSDPLEPAYSVLDNRTLTFEIVGMVASVFDGNNRVSGDPARYPRPRDLEIAAGGGSADTDSAPGLVSLRNPHGARDLTNVRQASWSASGPHANAIADVNVTFSDVSGVRRGLTSWATLSAASSGGNISVAVASVTATGNGGYGGNLPADGSAVPVRTTITFETDEGVTTTASFDIWVASFAPVISIKPIGIVIEARQNGTAYATIEVTNEGVGPAYDLALNVPRTSGPSSWLQVVEPSGGVLSELSGRSSTQMFTVLAAPPVVGSNPGDILAGTAFLTFRLPGPAPASYDAIAIPIEVTVVSGSHGDLSVEVTDEFTYHQAPAYPRVAGATVRLFRTIDDPLSSSPILQAVTGSSGIALFSDLAEGPYTLVVTSPDHDPQGYQAQVHISGGQLNSATVFLGRALVTVSFRVVPLAIDDSYTIVLETTFQTNVPAPVVTIEPPLLNYDYLVCSAPNVTTVVFTVTNHGLIAAKEATWYLPLRHPDLEFSMPQLELGDIAGRSSVEVPITIRRKPGAPSDPTQCDGYVLPVSTVSSGQVIPSNDQRRGTREEDLGGGVVRRTFEMSVTKAAKKWLTPGDHQLARRSTGGSSCDCANMKYYTLCGKKYYYTAKKVEAVQKEKRCGGTPGYKGGGRGGYSCGWCGVFNPRFPQPTFTWSPCDCVDQLSKWVVDCGVSFIPAAGAFNSGISCTTAMETKFWSVKAAVDCLNFGGSYVLDVISVWEPTQAGKVVAAGWNVAWCIYYFPECPPPLDPNSNGPQTYPAPNSGDPTSMDRRREVGRRAIKTMAAQAWRGDTRRRAADLDAALDAVEQQAKLVRDIYSVFAHAIDGGGNSSDAAAILRSRPSTKAEALLIGDWIRAYANAISESGPGGSYILQGEYDTLTNTFDLSGFVDPAVVPRVLARWNRTMELNALNIFEPEDVTDGGSTDIISRRIGNQLVFAGNAATQTWDSMNYPRGDFDSGLYEAKLALDDMAKSPNRGICAKVKLELEQQLVFQRQAFRASLDLSNENGNLNLSDVSTMLYVRPVRDRSIDAKNLFGLIGPVHAGELTGNLTSDGTGDGNLVPTSAGSAEWTFVPGTNAADPLDFNDPNMPGGPTQYEIGGELTYRQQLGLNATRIPLWPETVYVYPQPEITLHYFWPGRVEGDDPFTAATEPVKPFSVGLVAVNNGKGGANNFRIFSGQPKIVENEKGLVVSFALTKAMARPGLNDMMNPTDFPVTIPPSDSQQPNGLGINLGFVPPGKVATAIWLLESTLSGVFVDFSARLDHNSPFEDAIGSLITDLKTHELVHDVFVDEVTPGGSASLLKLSEGRNVLPADDGLRDFLANNFADANRLGDHLFSSEGAVMLVTPRANINGASTASDAVTVTSAGTNAWTIDWGAWSGTEATPSWMHFVVDDPAPTQELVSVLRTAPVSKDLSPALGVNVWRTSRVVRQQGQPDRTEQLLHIFDLGVNPAAGQSYSVSYAANPNHAVNSLTAPNPSQDLAGTVTINFGSAGTRRRRRQRSTAPSQQFGVSANADRIGASEATLAELWTVYIAPNPTGQNAPTPAVGLLADARFDWKPAPGGTRLSWQDSKGRFVVRMSDLPPSTANLFIAVMPRDADGIVFEADGMVISTARGSGPVPPACAAANSSSCVTTPTVCPAPPTSPVCEAGFALNVSCLCECVASSDLACKDAEIATPATKPNSTNTTGGTTGTPAGVPPVTGSPPRTPVASSSASTDGGMSGGAVAGLVIGLLVLFALLAALAFAVHRRMGPFETLPDDLCGAVGLGGDSDAGGDYGGDVELN
jgi:hypothetical protein